MNRILFNQFLKRSINNQKKSIFQQLITSQLINIFFLLECSVCFY